MANKIGSEQQSPSRPPIRLLVSVLLLGTLLAWWGTRDYRRLFGESQREPVAAGGVVLPQVTQEKSALLDRGSQIAQRQCAGCHEMAARSSAPSYREIVTFYRRKFPSAGNPDLRSRLAAAVTHPRPGWGNFAPGPSESDLSLDDRIALASWILNSFDRDNNTGEGVGK
ncbi:MAG TPA: c-type cytochrome [Candidatus Solibacter sp.]|jgi:cytochrome c551/c552|nr:c-type cytochrome [Candidatus Solibacter sp.]